MAPYRSNGVIKAGALLGAVLSAYGMYVESEMRAAAAMGVEYRAGCDLGTFASCSKVLTSPYAHILSVWGVVPRGSPLDVSNAFLGLLFYAGVVVHDWVAPPAALLAASVGSLVYTLYLAYILKFVLHDFCMVCLGMYVANIVIFVGAARLAALPRKRKGE